MIRVITQSTEKTKITKIKDSYSSISQSHETIVRKTWKITGATILFAALFVIPFCFCCFVECVRAPAIELENSCWQTSFERFGLQFGGAVANRYAVTNCNIARISRKQTGENNDDHMKHKKIRKKHCQTHTHSQFAYIVVLCVTLATKRLGGHTVWNTQTDTDTQTHICTCLTYWPLNVKTCRLFKITANRMANWCMDEKPNNNKKKKKTLNIPHHVRFVRAYIYGYVSVCVSSIISFLVCCFFFRGLAFFTSPPWVCKRI